MRTVKALPHNDLMEERESAYAELGGGWDPDRAAANVREKAAHRAGAKPLDEYQLFLRKARAWLKDQGVPAGKIAETLYSMTDMFREANWKPPPGHDGDSAEWRVRANFRLPPARLEANAKRVRDALNDARVRTVDPVGGSSPTTVPEEIPAPPPAADEAA